MNAIIRSILLGLLSVTVISSAQAAESSLKVVATFSVLGDLVKQVAGDDAEVSVLTPVGAEVHEWELVPSNFIAIEASDIVFYNGYGLEQWIGQVESAVMADVPVIAVAEASGYPTQPIITGELAGTTDPHLWMAPQASARYAQVIAAALSEARPDAADDFQRRADELAAALYALHDEITEALSAILEQHRLLVTSEAAFLYFAEAFGFAHDGIWGTNAEEEGTPRQIMRIVDLIKEAQPAAIFWESTTSDRHVRSVAAETGVATAGPLYVDSLSAPEGDAADYLSMLRHNAALLRDTLGVNDE